MSKSITMLDVRRVVKSCDKVQRQQQMQIVVTHTRQPQYLQHMMWQYTSKRSMQVCFTHLAASIFSAYNIAPISPVYNVAMYIKRRM